MDCAMLWIGMIVIAILVQDGDLLLFMSLAELPAWEHYRKCSGCIDYCTD